MSEIQFDTLRIQDNGDGVFHAQAPRAGVRLGSGVTRSADRITDTQGQTLDPAGPVVRDFMSRLGITTIEGLRLNPARQYLESFPLAEQAASQGDTVEARRVLEQGRLYATQAHLAFNESRGEQIIMRSSIQELRLLERDANSQADAGNVTAVEDAIRAARDVLIRLGTPLENWESSGLPFPPSAATVIEQRAFRQAIPSVILQAERSAQEGNVLRTREHLELIRQYFARASDPVPESMRTRLNEIERQSLIHAVTSYLAQAATPSQQGNVDATRALIQQAREASRLSSTPFTAEQNNAASLLERQAYQNAIPRLFERIDQALQSAQDTHRTANVAGIRLQIQAIRDDAALSLNPLTVEQEARIRQILDRAYQIDIEWRFHQAEGGANLGKVDDTIVPLNAARELAAQHQIPFDERWADALLRLALTNGVDLSFRNAQCFALAGDEANMRLHLSHARDYSARIGQAFSESRAREAEALLQQTVRQRGRLYEQQHCSGLLHSGMSSASEESEATP